MKSSLFIVCKTMFTIGESQAISHANRTANTRTPNCQSLQGKIWNRKILWSENVDLNSTTQPTKMETAATNSGAEGTSHNEFRMLKYFKRKWKRFWIISLNTYRRVYNVLALTAGLPFFTCKCDEMHLRWVFTVQTAVILLKNIFEFMFNNTPKYSFLCVTRGLEVRPLP